MLELIHERITKWWWGKSLKPTWKNVGKNVPINHRQRVDAVVGCEGRKFQRLCDAKAMLVRAKNATFRLGRQHGGSRASAVAVEAAADELS